MDRPRIWQWQDCEYAEAPWILQGPTRGAKVVGKLPPRSGKTKARYVIRIQHGTCHCAVCGCRTTEDVPGPGQGCGHNCCSELCT